MVDAVVHPLLFNSGVKIAEVRPDDSSTLCEDSCTYANDGTCDEAGAVSVDLLIASRGRFWPGGVHNSALTVSSTQE